MRNPFVTFAFVIAAAAAASGCISVSTGSQSPPTRDLCNAADHRGFIGTPLAAATFPVGVRILAPDTMATQDYVPSRLNVLVDAKGLITGVRCG
jgi:hypothetical protein